MKEPRIGFSMHPRWIEFAGVNGFLDPLRQAGLQAVEFVLDPNDPYWARFPPLISECRDLGLELAFHAPYAGDYPPAGFAAGEAEAIRQRYAPMLEIASRYGPATVVVHGASAPDKSREALQADTAAFLSWILASFPDLTVALENLIDTSKLVKIGSEPAEMLAIAAEVHNARMGFCWDMGHQVMNRNMELPNPNWLDRVIHVHLHDVSPQHLDHYPLMHGRVPYWSWLQALKAGGFAGIVTLEIKGGQLSYLGYDQILDLLKNSVRSLAQIVSD